MTEAIPAPVEDQPPTNRARTEPRDVNVGVILYIALGLIGTGVIVYLASWWTFDYLKARDSGTKRSQFPLAAAERGRLPPEPRLEQIDRMTAPQGRLYAEEQRRLESYGWVDEKAKIVRIPIDRAMKLMVEQKRLPANRAEARP